MPGKLVLTRRDEREVMNYKHYESQSHLFTNKFGSLSGRFLILLMFGADLIINESAFYAFAILLLKVNFLTLVLLYSK